MTEQRVPHALGESLDFLRVIWAFDHALQRASARMEQSTGVTAPQRMVIRIVGRFPGISAGQLSEILHTHPSTVTGLLHRLAQKRLITRGRDPNDARRSTIGLTPKGRLVDAEAQASVEAMVVTSIERLGRGTIRTVKDALEALTQMLDRVADARGRG